MGKDVFWFYHDLGARKDKKTAALIREYKSTGYGVYWAIIELMHEEDGEVEMDDLTIDNLASEISEEPALVREIIEKCVAKYKLFDTITKQIEAPLEANEAVLEANRSKTKQPIFASFLVSNRVRRNLNSKEEAQKIKAEAGRLGGIKSGLSRRTAILAKQNEADTKQNEQEERRSDKIYSSSLLWFDEKMDLPATTLLAAEYNQFALTRSKNTDFVLGQWKIFLSERMSDSEERLKNFKKIEDLTSYFLNWLRPKIPKENGKSNQPSDPGDNGKLGTSHARIHAAKKWGGKS